MTWEVGWVLEDDYVENFVLLESEEEVMRLIRKLEKDPKVRYYWARKLPGECEECYDPDDDPNTWW